MRIFVGYVMREKKEREKYKGATLYVGETSCTIQERAIEHWTAARGSRKAREGSSITLTGSPSST